MMRSGLFCAFILSGFALMSQTPSFALYQGAGTTVPILNGSSIPVTTTATAINFNGVKIKNLAANTVSLSVVRTISFQSPAINVTPTSKPSTYFCFGNACFPNYVSTVTGSDYTILLGAGNTDTNFPYSDDSDYNNQPFKIYLEEGSTQGKYYVNYKVFNVANQNDSILFTIRYNDFLEVQKYSLSPESVSEPFPNPTHNIVKLALNFSEEKKVEIRVTNQLGQLIYCSLENNLGQGKQYLELNTSQWNEGFYNLDITANGVHLNRKLVISK